MAGNETAENGGDHAPVVAVHEANGGGPAPAPAVDAVNGAVEDGGDPNPAPAEAAADGGNAALVQAAAVVDAGAVFLDLSLMPEAVIYQFFIRMPAAMVARCRAVCRMWRDLTSTEAFLRDHHLHRSRRPMPLFFYCIDDDHVGVHLRAADIRRRESFPVLRFAHLDPALASVDPRVVRFRIEGSCDGILLLSYDARLYACNPCTRRWARLPRIDYLADIFALYAHDLGGGREYRVLYRCYQLDLNACRFTYWILSLPESVRLIGRPTNLEVLDRFQTRGIWPPIMVQERLHWQPLRLHQDNRYILVFDTVDEIVILPC
ncbi:hypothetical protein QOZ80_2BG0188910 [Eleusine coracana subsp. coracana]|nr:hypothetical protein QOZ80_2BG0188910 [Eleusine coracana subsp. coracana]